MRRSADVERHSPRPAGTAPDADAYAANLLAQIEKISGDLEKSESFLRTLFETVPVGIFVVDAQTRHVIDLNRHALGLIGGTRRQIVGRRCHSMICPATEQACPILDLKQTVDKSERIVLTADGNRLPVLKSVVPLSLKGLDILIECFIDITEFKAAEAEVLKANAELERTQARLLAAMEEAETAALQDPLTKLPNRRLLLERLRHALVSIGRNGNGAALLFIDLDNFKDLNDTLGHDIGDSFLVLVSQRLTGCVRASDTVARIGGDEFVVLLENLSNDPIAAAAQTRAVAQTMLDRMATPFHLAGRAIDRTISIGIAMVGNASATIEDLMRQADLAMYQAKAAGRNTLRFFNPEMQAEVTARAVLDAELRDALRQNRFVLHYQPLVDGAARVTGAEALIRWRHPDKGLVQPTDFIPFAEETGLIEPLGRWVLEATCEQLARWAERPEMAGIKVSVNVSARQFRVANFVEDLLAILDRSGAPPENLRLELTETMLLANFDDTIVRMAAIKAKGVSFSLDDFGTGYSSLSYLKRLPLDQLKIDQSFVRNIVTDAGDAAITRAVVSLARSMGLSVVAEGVETQAQRDILAANGCRHFQGYFYSRPLPPEAFERFVCGLSRQRRQSDAIRTGSTWELSRPACGAPKR